MLIRLAKDGPEQRAIDAGEIDAVVDYSSSNIVLLPAAQRALDALRAVREAANASSVGNRLLAALPRADYQRLLPHLEPLTLRFGEVIHEPGAPIRHAYFPIDCVVSLVATVESEQGLQVELVGSESMTGIPLALGAEVSCVRGVVLVTGTVLRLDAEHLKKALRLSPPLQDELNRHAHLKLEQARRTVACNGFHSVEGRLARWLLTTGDRVRSEEFFLTQVHLAKMLGVRRATVNEAAGPLQQRRLITYSRGSIRILDRQGLEAASCSCYARGMSDSSRSNSALTTA